MNDLRAVIRHALMTEGGLKVPVGRRSDLTPVLVRTAAHAYTTFISGWNAWLREQGAAPVEPIRLSGSSTHAEQDELEGRDAVYGDIDYLVSFPIIADDGDRRRSEAASAKRYASLMVQYLREEHPKNVDVELTLAGADPLSVIMLLPDGALVQVDTVVTHPSYAEWMKGRYTPERGIKGYVTGNLYKALGDFLVMTIGTEGVTARLRGTERVPARFRTGITYKSITTNFRNFLVDIATYLLGHDYRADPLLRAHPGLDPDRVTVDDLAQGILGLANTLDAAGAYDRDVMLRQILSSFEDGLAESVDKKAGRDLSPDKEQRLRELNATQVDRVRRAFGL